MLIFFGSNIAVAEISGGYDMTFCGAHTFQNSPTYTNLCQDAGQYESPMDELKARAADRALRSLWKKAKSQARRASLRQEEELSDEKEVLRKFFKDPRYNLKVDSHKFIMSVKVKF